MKTSDSQATPAPPLPAGVLKLLTAAILLYILCTLAYDGLWKPLNWYGIDYDKHWYAARAVLDGRPTYIGYNLWLGFNYPQATAFAFCWLGWFTFETSQHVFKMTMLAFMVVIWVIAWRVYRPATPDWDGLSATDRQLRRIVLTRWGLITALAVASYQPAVSCLFLGNIDPYNALLAVAMVGAILTGRPRLAGAVWAVLTLVKLLPFALVVPIVLWRRWKILEGFLLALAGYALLLTVTGHLKDEWYFYHELAPYIPLWWRTLSISPTRYLYQYAGAIRLYDDPYNYLIINRISTAIYGGFYVGLVAWLWRRRLDWLHGLETAIVCYPLVSPLLEYHHFVWILPALLLQLRRWTEGHMPNAVAVPMLAGWTMLFASRHIFFNFSTRGAWTEAIQLVAYLAILSVTIHDALRTCASRAPAARPGLAEGGQEPTTS